MRQIVGYYIIPPGDLWFRLRGGEMRPATERERGTITSLPGLPPAIGSQLPQTESMRSCGRAAEPDLRPITVVQ